MQKVIGAWAAIAVVLGVGHTLWGWWGVVALAVLGIVTYLGYEFYRFIMYDAPRVSDEMTSGGTSVSANQDDWWVKAEERSRESSRRHDRYLKLHHLETDLEHAKKLMELEEEARGLQARYARRGSRGSRYSPEVEEALRRIFEEIDNLKQGRVA